MSSVNFIVRLWVNAVSCKESPGLASLFAQLLRCRVSYIAFNTSGFRRWWSGTASVAAATRNP